MSHKYEFPVIEPKEAMDWSLNITAYTMLRNMVGAPVHLPGTLRRLAYRSSRNDEPLRVLEITHGIPSIALELYNPRKFRQFGDVLQYYYGSPDLDEITSTSYNNHEIETGFSTPKIEITTISPKDYILQFLLGNDSDFSYASDVRKRMSELFCGDGQYSASPSETLVNYLRAKNDGRVIVCEGDLAKNLDDLYDDGKRYDFGIFNQLMFSEDRFEVLKGLQSVISKGGVAYVPLKWWCTPMMGQHDVQEGVLLADKVNIDGVDLPLEEYLETHYPDAFEVRKFPGVKTLVVKGTSNPVEFPSMTAEIIDPHISVYSNNPPHYYPDMPVMRWMIE